MEAKSSRPSDKNGWPLTGYPQNSDAINARNAVLGISRIYHICEHSNILLWFTLLLKELNQGEEVVGVEINTALYILTLKPAFEICHRLHTVKPTFLNGLKPASFYFLSYNKHHKFDYKWLKCRWCSLDSNPGRQDGRLRRIHWAMATT